MSRGVFCRVGCNEAKKARVHTHFFEELSPELRIFGVTVRQKHTAVVEVCICLVGVELADPENILSARKGRGVGVAEDQDPVGEIEIIAKILSDLRLAHDDRFVHGSFDFGDEDRFLGPAQLRERQKQVLRFERLVLVDRQLRS